MEQLQMTFEETQQTKFQQYHKSNPEVYDKFKSLALKTIEKGFKRFSARGVFQVMRWMTGGYVKADGYKFNNNYTPYYVRMFEKEFPQHKGFFEKRKIKSKQNLG